MPSISKSYSFSAAHHLPQMPDGHPCKRVHGHNYEVTVLVRGKLDKRGFVLDYHDLDRIVKPIIEALDHQDLAAQGLPAINGIVPADAVTAENLAFGIHRRVKTDLLMVLGMERRKDQIQVRVKETAKTEATYP